MDRQGIEPPRLARRLFQWYSENAQVEDLLGDVDELFHSRLQSGPIWKAKLKYWANIVSLIFSYTITSRRRRAALHPYSQRSIDLKMIRNYILIARRMMDRNKVYTMINVLGLTLGISACIIVYTVIHHELSFDRFHPDKERIYRIETGDDPNRKFCSCIQAPGYVALRDGFVGAEAITGYHQFDAKASVEGKDGVKNFERNSTQVILTDPAYFKIFQYEWLAGNPDVLAKPLKVVLTQNRALAYFGSLSPDAIVGKTITYNDSLHVTVAGVVKDWTNNSDLKQTEFISFSTIEQTFLRDITFLDNWGIMQHSSQSFIKLKKGDTPESVTAGLEETIRTKSPQKILFRLQPLTEIHFNLDDEGNNPLRSLLYVLSGLAAFIMVIAAINFVNLSTAQSFRRTKEIVVRKVMGSQKFQIVFQFLTETFLLTTISLLFSLLLVNPLLTILSGYIPSVYFDFWSVDNWMFLVVLLVVTAFLAGTYPALVISSRALAKGLSYRSGERGRDRGALRKVLIVFQFSISLFFIVATLVIGSQMNFIRTTDRGFSTDRVLTFRTTWGGKVSTMETLASRLRLIDGVEQVSLQGFTPMGFAQWRSSYEYVGKKGKVAGEVSIKGGDEYYIPLFKIRLVAGRNFGATDSLSTDVVVNESFVKSMGIASPPDALGEQFTMNGMQLTIQGVAHDFHETSFRMPIGPCIIMNNRRERHTIAVLLGNSDMTSRANTISKAGLEFKALYPDEPFAAHFIEDEIGWMHGEEQRTSSLAGIAMGVTIFISCMGIFGLAMFTATMRTREIGIRKVLGASVVEIVRMLTQEFVVLIMISVLIAMPVAWYYMNDWLSGFTYRTELSWWFFVAAAGISIGTGLLTVSYQSFKAANSDPVEAIKIE